jgi:hypothetical protein
MALSHVPPVSELIADWLLSNRKVLAGDDIRPHKKKPPHQAINSARRESH